MPSDRRRGEPSSCRRLRPFRPVTDWGALTSGVDLRAEGHPFEAMFHGESLGQGLCSESRDWTASRRIRSYSSRSQKAPDRQAPASRSSQLPRLHRGGCTAGRSTGGRRWRASPSIESRILRGVPRKRTSWNRIRNRIRLSFREPTERSSVPSQGGEPLNVIVARRMRLNCEDQQLCVAQCAPYMQSLPDDI